MVARRASSGGSRDRDEDRGSRRGGREDRPRDRDRERGRDDERSRDRGRDDRGSRRNDRDRDDRSERRTSSRDRDDRGGGRSSGRSGGKSGGFVYKPRDPEAVKKRAERQGGNFDSILKANFDLWRPKAGDNLIRVLPPTWDGADDCVFTIWVHKYIGPDESNYLCLRKMLGKRCPACIEAKACADAGDKEGSYAYKAKEDVACWIVDRDDKADPPLPQFYTMSQRQWQDITKVSIDKKSGKVLIIDEPNKGFDLSIFRSGSGQRTRYSGFAFDREPSPIDEDPGVQDEILEFCEKNPIPDVLNYFDEDYIENIVTGTSPERDKDAAAAEEEEEEPEDRAAREDRGRGRGRSSSRDEDDEDEERGSRRGGRSRDRDDDAEDDDNNRGANDDEDNSDDNGEGDEPDEDRDEDRGRGRGSRRSGGGSKRDDDPPPPRRGSGRRGASRDEEGDKGGGRRRYRD